MVRRSRKDKVVENAVNISELAAKVARDKKFRKQLASAYKHGRAAQARTRGSRGLSDTARRFLQDQALQSELRRTRDELEAAYGRLSAARRRSRLRRVFMVLGAGSLAAMPQVRQRVSALAGRRRSLDQLTKEELYARAQDAEIPGRSEMSKEELINALSVRGS
jgi:hypothetical protein